MKALARQKFETQMTQHWNSAEVPDAIYEAYESTVDTDRGLRDIILQAFREHPQLANRKDIEGAVKETPGLAWELFRIGWGMPIR